MEFISSILVFFGAALLLVSWVYLIIISFQNRLCMGLHEHLHAAASVLVWHV
jgi:hypothetical protein